MSRQGQKRECQTGRKAGGSLRGELGVKNRVAKQWKNMFCGQAAL